MAKLEMLEHTLNCKTHADRAKDAAGEPSLAEMTRLGVALGGRAETFMGLSGLGDLVLTATGDLSRNRRLGLLLAAGEAPQAAMATLGHVAEGMLCAHEVAARAAMLGVDMPICQAVAELLQGRLAARDALARLMGRGPGVETGGLVDRSGQSGR